MARRAALSGMKIALVIGLVVSLGSRLASAGPIDPEEGETRPGLVATYRSLAIPSAVVHRVDPKPAFTWGDSSPHPRIPPGPFEVVWEGLLKIQDSGPIRFDAFVGGEVEVQVGDARALEGRGESESSRLDRGEPLTLALGFHPLKIRYRSLAGVPSRLQIFWSADSFAREPLPAWRLAHLSRSIPELARDELAASGKVWAERLGCARCHQSSLPSVNGPPPGPSLADARGRLDRDWILRWLDGPSTVKPGSRMPSLFAKDRAGFVERWVLAEYLAGPGTDRREEASEGKHRAGRLAFFGLGCAACHLVPERGREGEEDPGRSPLEQLGDRLSERQLSAFLSNPQSRYPDGRMPRLPIGGETARDLAAYLLLWSKPTEVPATSEPPPTNEELRSLAGKLKASPRDPGGTAAALMKARGCNSCHPGLGPSAPLDLPISLNGPKGCLSREGPARYDLDDASREAISAYLEIAQAESHHSPFAERQEQLTRAGCLRCHQRDSDRPPAIEEVGRTLSGAYLQLIPYQKTPRLTNVHQKLTRSYLRRTAREGISVPRDPEYTYRMPAFGERADALLQALAEGDGERVLDVDPPARVTDDPTLGTLAGPDLTGSRGYGCISCHAWNGRQLVQSDPGAAGPDLTRVAGRIRRDWFDRYFEDPARSYPGTPMPSIFPRGQRPAITSILGGDPIKQREALWSYFSQGSAAPAPQPPAPLPITAPSRASTPLIAQIPIRTPDNSVVESLCVLSSSHDLLIYDLAVGAPRSLLVGARILRNVQGRTRQFLASGTAEGLEPPSGPALQLVGPNGAERPVGRDFLGFGRVAEGARLRFRLRFAGSVLEFDETLRIVRDESGGRLLRTVHVEGLARGSTLELHGAVAEPRTLALASMGGDAKIQWTGNHFTIRLDPDAKGANISELKHELPPARPAPAWEGKSLATGDPEPGKLERPGYRAFAYERPKTVSGEDRVMPAAVAVDPRDGRVFAASLKTGELFVLNHPEYREKARFENYAGGLFQDALSMLAEEDALYVLHRRNLTRIKDLNGDGEADQFDRVLALPHGVADTYDYAYGLVRDKDKHFIISYAPYANEAMPGSGGVLSVEPGQPPREVAFGLRNPLGWASGPDGEVFFTDNQGEWVAANKLGHVREGHFFGYPNASQRQHAEKPLSRPAVWVPYAWAHSINGMTYDNTGGKFGPFAGQFFLAELTFGGAIIRANVERVNGQFQGACFPFWGKGLLGPVSLAFDPKGPLYVGGITEPGWMAQPDRGALFRIDFTGETPFEMQSIHAQPRGFRVVFTREIDPLAAADPASYRLERYRYEYTGSYGSPELDRAVVPLKSVAVAPDRRSVELTTVPALIPDRVYFLSAPGVRSKSGEPLVQPAGAYTLNEVPIAEK